MPQPKLHWTAYLWPGLSHLWVRGSWVGLLLALGFTALANVLIATSLVWDQWLPTRIRWFGWAALASVWLFAFMEARADWRRWLEQWSAGEGDEIGPQRSDRLFREALGSYLAGDWVTAEQSLRQLVRRDPRDIESRLTLATMLRRQRRYPEAEAALRELERFEAAAPWQYELQQQWLALNRANQTLDSDQQACSELDEHDEVTAKNEETNHPCASDERTETQSDPPAGRLAA